MDMEEGLSGQLSSGCLRSMGDWESKVRASRLQLGSSPLLDTLYVSWEGVAVAPRGIPDCREEMAAGSSGVAVPGGVGDFAMRGRVASGGLDVDERLLDGRGGEPCGLESRDLIVVVVTVVVLVTMTFFERPVGDVSRPDEDNAMARAAGSTTSAGKAAAIGAGLVAWSAGGATMFTTSPPGISLIGTATGLGRCSRQLLRPLPGLEEPASGFDPSTEDALSLRACRGSVAAAAASADSSGRPAGVAAGTLDVAAVPREVSERLLACEVSPVLAVPLLPLSSFGKAAAATMPWTIREISAAGSSPVELPEVAEARERLSASKGKEASGFLCCCSSCCCCSPPAAKALSRVGAPAPPRLTARGSPCPRPLLEPPACPCFVSLLAAGAGGGRGGGAAACC
mmetsp:Transcript_6076/g.16921  ORF Transcript_6076/g.16921 Transcript_6076/m.16921 type:complete len:398 (-) Transcript_6076:2505-3698(-)